MRNEPQIRREIQRLLAAHDELLQALRLAHTRHRDAFAAYEAMVDEAMEATGAALMLLGRLLDDEPKSRDEP